MAIESSSLSVVFLVCSLLCSGMVSGGEEEEHYLKTWCVAKPSSDHKTLLDNLNYACSCVDCSSLNHGCCSSHDNLISHASIAMNLYYKANGCHDWACDFKNSGLVTITDPSFGDCVYE